MGSRITLRYTRAIINAIHSGELTSAQTTSTPIFSLHVCPPQSPEALTEHQVLPSLVILDIVCLVSMNAAA